MILLRILRWLPVFSSVENHLEAFYINTILYVSNLSYFAIWLQEYLKIRACTIYQAANFSSDWQPLTQLVQRSHPCIGHRWSVVGGEAQGGAAWL